MVNGHQTNPAESMTRSTLTPAHFCAMDHLLEIGQQHAPAGSAGWMLLVDLQRAGYVDQPEPDTFALTSAGRAEVEAGKAEDAAFAILDCHVRAGRDVSEWPQADQREHIRLIALQDKLREAHPA